MRLEPSIQNLDATQDQDFNSIKVRLEPERSGYRIENRKFQFHKGAIRTDFNVARLVLIYSFQFHKGAIRTTLHTLTSSTSSNFNSIKVRLERPMPRSWQSPTTFQFHKGAIRTVVLLVARYILNDFNSIKVRLEHATARKDALQRSFQFHKGAIRT